MEFESVYNFEKEREKEKLKETEEEKYELEEIEIKDEETSSTDDKLTDDERFKVYTLINLYELVLGFLVGMVLNEISYKMFPHTKEELLIVSIVMLILLGTFIINCLLYLRRRVEDLPGLDKLTKKSDFKHPPPIALTFGFWMTQNQLRSRSEALKLFFYNYLASPLHTVYN